LGFEVKRFRGRGLVAGQEERGKKRGKEQAKGKMGCGGIGE